MKTFTTKRQFFAYKKKWKQLREYNKTKKICINLDNPVVIGTTKR